MGLRPIDGYAWEKQPPAAFSIATGRFAERSPGPEGPKLRPLLITHVFKRKSDGIVLCRVFYGTTRNLNQKRPQDLYIQQLSALDQLKLRDPTRFVLYDRDQSMFLPWLHGYFEPWDDCTTPVRSKLPEQMQKFVKHSLSLISPLPNPPLK